MAAPRPLRPYNPPIRVDDEVIFWDGSARKLRKEELARLRCGEEVRVQQPIPMYQWGVLRQ